MNHEKLTQRIKQRLSELEAIDRRRVPRIVESFAGGRCRVDGQDAVNFGSNDYLGLAFERHAEPASTEPVQKGSTASALIAGRTPVHARLEEALAEFETTESALLFPTGYAANIGVLTGLAEAGDVVICDRENHASIIDGARLSAAELLVYRRDRLESLEQSLHRRRGSYRHVFLVTDGVFSMDGTVAPLADLCGIAERFDASVIVDEAHATGVLGRHGRGACEHCGVEDHVLARVGTMSKAMGGLGGFVVSSEPIVELLRNTARTQFFSTALPPIVCQAMLQSLQIIRTQPERRLQLVNLHQRIQTRICDSALNTIANGAAPIVPVIIPGEKEAIRVSTELLKRGFFVPAVRSPTVRQGTERLRLSFGVGHSADSLDAAVRAIAELVSGLTDAAPVS